MTPRFQRSLRPLICIVVGLLVFIFMIPNYMSLFMSYKGDDDAGEALKESFSAYESISFGDESAGEYLEELLGDDAHATFLLSLVAILLILAIIVAVVAILWGVLGVLKEFAGIDVMEMAHLDAALTEKIPSWILLGNMLVHAVAAFVTLLTCLINLQTGSLWGVEISMGLQPGVGLFLLLILGIAAFVGYRYLDKLVPAEERGPSVVYECSVCKARAKASAKFCSACGGPVVAVEKAPAGNVCPACGARMKADDKFCPACGTAAAPRRDVCSVCGTKLPANAQFCTVCGTAVPTQTEPPVQQPTAQQPTESPEDIQVQ